MSSIENYIIFNGKILKHKAFTLKTSNRSFLYGDGLFESIRVIDGTPLFLYDHLSRLHSGMKLLKMSFEYDIIPDFENLFYELLKANKIDTGAYIRLNVFRKDGGKYLPTNRNVDFLIEIFRIQNEFLLQTQKVTLGIFSDLLKPINILNLIKSNNAQFFVMASIYASENNFDEVLILNENKQIIEATSSNLFAIIGNKLISPPLDSGVLPGIMRKQVLKLCDELGFEILEQCPTQSQLIEADEIFLTNAIIGIKAVDFFINKNYAKTQSTKLLQKISLIKATSL